MLVTLYIHLVVWWPLAVECLCLICAFFCLLAWYIQGSSNMTGTAAACLHTSLPVIFEPPCIL